MKNEREIDVHLEAIRLAGERNTALLKEMRKLISDADLRKERRSLCRGDYLALCSLLSARRKQIEENNAVITASVGMIVQYATDALGEGFAP